MNRYRPAVALSVALAASGCAAYPHTRPLATYDLTQGYRFDTLKRTRVETPKSTNSDEIFVMLAFSGGGTRAGALAYGALRQLDNVKFYWDDEKKEPVSCAPADSAECLAKERSLLDEVDVISSVSGGSFVAAYYGLHGKEIFDPQGRFHSGFLHQPLEHELMANAIFRPKNWKYFKARPEIATNIYADKIFGDATFGDLKARPYVILNASDMSTGARFEFTQEQFDLLCADLSVFPLARAVAASSAVPALLNSMTIDSYNRKGCGYNGPGSGSPDDWVPVALAGDRLDPHYTTAQDMLAFREPQRRYLHLLDGGLVDNVGLRSILRSLNTTDRPVQRTPSGLVRGGWSVREMIQARRVKKVIVISINAKANHSHTWDTKAEGPGTFTAMRSAAAIPSGHYSLEALEMLRQYGMTAGTDDKDPAAPRFYGLEVALENLDDAEERRFLSGVGTSLQLDPLEVRCLVDRSGLLLRQGRSVTHTGGQTFASFVADDLRGGRILIPSAESPDRCTAPVVVPKTGLPRHAFNLGVQGTTSFARGSDLENGRTAFGLTLRAPRPRGWGLLIEAGKAHLPVRADVSGGNVGIGDLDMWTVMAGAGHTQMGKRTELTLGVTAGFGFGGFDLSDAAHDAYGQKGFFRLRANASNALLLKPQATYWHNLTKKLAATAGVSYLIGRPTVTITSEQGRPYDKKVVVDSLRLSAGLGIKVF